MPTRHSQSIGHSTRSKRFGEPDYERSGTANATDQFARKSVHKPSKPANTNNYSGRKPMFVQTILKPSRATTFDASRAGTAARDRYITTHNQSQLER
jgi:hypothetical protein